MLIDRGANRNPLSRDLGLRSGCVRCAELLLESAGHEDLNRALTTASLFSDSKSVKILLDRGADASAVVSTPVVSDGGVSGRALAPSGNQSARSAVQKSLPVPQHADIAFLKKAGCGVDTIGYILAGLASTRYQPDEATHALARYLLRRQAADGGWRIATQRPPLESSDFEATEIALRGLQLYAPKPQRADYAKAVQRGSAWLSQAKPPTNEDRAFQLLGLGWSGGSREAIRNAARELVALQNSDGGWAQLPTLASDAYATGQALTALAQTGGLAATEAAYQRGVRYLLNTQLEDGSWFVRTRATPVQPYFDSEFPHERDQFISVAATNWAVMGLVPAVR
jgi:hypothetical protein